MSQITVNYNTVTLSNGLRVIHLPSSSQVVYCGIAVGAGTRDEEPGEEGLAHFCEHLSFKGTSRRSAVQVINALEGVGGELNAFTNKEDTVYYCAILRDHIRRAVDVLCDIVFHSEYPQVEVEKEREVVCDEIESYEDTPSELIFDDIENVLFSGHPLGHNILGSKEQVRSYGSDDARRFTGCHYRAANCVFFASGDVDFQRLVKMLEADGVVSIGENADVVHVGGTRICPQEVVGGEIVRERGTHQAHVIMASRSYSADDSRRWALYLLNNIIGGPGLNSRLNLSLRERHGLVYSVESSMVVYRDAGVWTTYFGCDAADVRRCQRLVRRELDRMMERQLSPSQIRAARRQLEGQLSIAADSREQFALDFAKNYLHTGKVRDLTAIMWHIQCVTPEDIQEVARELFAPERMTTLIYR